MKRNVVARKSTSGSAEADTNGAQVALSRMAAVLMTSQHTEKYAFISVPS